MEGRFSVVVQNRNPGPAAFDDLTPHIPEQGFDSAPLDIAGDRIGEYGNQGFPMGAIHDMNDTTFCHQVKWGMAIRPRAGCKWR